MKHYIFAATLALVAVPGWAQDLRSVQCKIYGMMAYNIMGQRQYGRSYEDIMSRIENKDDFGILADEAFKLGIAPDADSKQLLMDTFRDVTVDMCMGERV